MRARRAWRAGLSGLAVAAALALAAAGAYRTAQRALAERIASALGPDASVAAVRLVGRSVVVDGVRIGAPRGWPAADALRVERVTVVPSLRSLLGGTVRIARVTLHRPALVARRTGSGVEVLPALGAGAPAAGGGPAVVLDRVAVEDGSLELYDAVVARPALRLRLDGIEATVDDVAVPVRPGRTQVALAAVARGVRRNGAVRASGWVDVARGDAESSVELRGIDLVAIAPYLVRVADARVVGGAADLMLAGTVRAGRVRAPGRLVLAGLALGPSRGVADTILGVPRAAALALLRDGPDGTIDLAFTLEGDVASPQLRLDEALTTRLATGLGARVGVDPGGMAAGVGGVAERSVGAATALARGVGRMVSGVLARPVPRR